MGFAKRLAALGDLYVNDAFSTAHRAHASTEAIAHLLPAAAGRLMQAELEALAGALTAPKRPVAAIVGGAKISTKLDLLGNLVGKVDVLVIGGAMANTFLAAQGLTIGKSLAEPDMAATVKDVLKAAKQRGCAVVLPVDAVVAREFKANAPHETVAVDAVPADAMILDVGPRSVAALEAKLAECRTCVWNGPLGAFETPPFEAGTVAVARRAAALTKAGKLLTVAGGGDTVAALAAGRGGRRFQLCLDGRRRLPRMARGQGPARRRRAECGRQVVCSQNRPACFETRSLRTAPQHEDHPVLQYETSS